MSDRLTGIEVFVRAVKLGGLSAAGRAMGISPTMASRHLNALETRLGTMLVKRSTRRLALTDAGVDYLERAERFLAEIEEADAAAAAQSRNIEGQLRISVPATFGVMHIAPLVPAFCRQYPKVSVELGLSDSFVDLVEERWDVAIRIGRLRDSSLVARKLASLRMSVCASPAYLDTRGTPETLADLASHDCLIDLLHSAAEHPVWRFGANGSHKINVHGSLKANNGEALLKAAIAGQGLIYGPRFVAAEAVAEKRLVEIDLRADLLDIGGVYAVTHPTRRPTAKTRAWIDYLYGARSCFSNL